MVGVELTQRLGRRRRVCRCDQLDLLIPVKSERNAATSGPRSSFSWAAERPNCRPLPRYLRQSAVRTPRPWSCP